MRLQGGEEAGSRRFMQAFLAGVLVALAVSGCGGQAPAPGAPSSFGTNETSPSTPGAPGVRPTEPLYPYASQPVSSLKKYPKVILGKENWLYYGEPMNRLEREGVLTDDQLRRAVDELVYVDNMLEAQGVLLLVVLVPDKQFVYPEFMPEIYNDVVDAQLSSYERTRDALSSSGIEFIDTLPTLLEKKKETGLRLYYMRDNKWNEFGNLLMTQEITSRLGSPAPRYELSSVDTSEDRVVTAEIGNDLNLMMESLVPWYEKGAPEPVYSVSGGEGAPGILWYGDCFGAPMTDFIRQDWPNTVTYVSLWSNYGFPLSFREDLQRRLNGEKIVVLELDEHYRQELSKMLVPESPKVDESWTSIYDWPADVFMAKWRPVGKYGLELIDGRLLVSTDEPAASFYSTDRLALTASRKYYLVVELTSPAYTGMLADFSPTATGEFSFDWLQGQHVYEGENTLIFPFPVGDYVGAIRSLRIYLGDKPGTYEISGAAVYADVR